MDVRETRFDVGGVLSLGLDDADAVTRRLVVAELDPFPPLPAAAETDIVLERAAARWRPALVDIHGLAADGSISASDGRCMYVVVEDRVASIPDPWRDDEVRFAYQPGFPVVRIFSSLIRPTIASVVCSLPTRSCVSGWIWVKSRCRVGRCHSRSPIVRIPRRSSSLTDSSPTPGRASTFRSRLVEVVCGDDG